MRRITQNLLALYMHVESLAQTPAKRFTSIDQGSGVKPVPKRGPAGSTKEKLPKKEACHLINTFLNMPILKNGLIVVKGSLPLQSGPMFGALNIPS